MNTMASRLMTNRKIDGYIMSNDLVRIRQETLGTNPNICLEDEQTQQMSLAPKVKLLLQTTTQQVLVFRFSQRCS